MHKVIYKYQIPDPARPVQGDRRRLCSFGGELVPFLPARLRPEDVIGRSVEVLSICVGTYGMGIPFASSRVCLDWTAPVAA